jgi:hypothetical protein
MRLDWWRGIEPDMRPFDSEALPHPGTEAGRRTPSSARMVGTVHGGLLTRSGPTDRFLGRRQPRQDPCQSVDADTAQKPGVPRIRTVLARPDTGQVKT